MKKDEAKSAVIRKQCRCCLIEKDIDCFVKSKAFSSGFDTICIECNRLKTRLWKKNNREKRNIQERKEYSRKKNKDLRLMYGITLVQYMEMLEEQGSMCAICGKKQSELTRWLSVDHNHMTGKIRALLCPHCNSLLGHARESQEILTKAIGYLNEHN